MADVTAGSPTGTILGKFRPKEKFNWIDWDDEGIPTAKGIYLPKFEYVIRTPLLLEKAKEWAADGKIKLVEED